MNERVRTCILTGEANLFLGRLCFLAPYLRVLSKYKNRSKNNITSFETHIIV